MRFVYFRTWLKNFYESYTIKTKVRLISGITYSQGRQEVGENTVMIEAFEDGQTRVTFIYDGSFDIEDGRLEVHNREGVLPQITEEASRGIQFKGIDGQITGVSLLVNSYKAIYFNEGDDSWTGRWTHGSTSGLITNRSFDEGYKVQLLQTRLGESIFQMKVPSNYRNGQEFNVKWMRSPIENEPEEIKYTNDQNQIERQEVDGFIFEHIVYTRENRIPLIICAGFIECICGMLVAAFGLLDRTVFQWTFGTILAVLWLLALLKIRDNKFCAFFALVYFTQLYKISDQFYDM